MSWIFAQKPELGYDHATMEIRGVVEASYELPIGKIFFQNRIRIDNRFFQEDPEKSVFEELSRRIDEALRGSPVQDVEKNLRALLAGWFDRMDLVLREDFDAQRRLLERAQAKLAELEARVAELEKRR